MPRLLNDAKAPRKRDEMCSDGDTIDTVCEPRTERVFERSERAKGLKRRIASSTTFVTIKLKRPLRFCGVVSQLARIQQKTADSMI
jgi:hypothetical protein